MNMNKPYITFTSEGLKTLFNGALGSMTFGMYHMYVTDQKMKMNNNIQDQKMKMNNNIQDQKMKEQDQRHESQIKELKDRVSRRWF